MPPITSAAAAAAQFPFPGKIGEDSKHKVDYHSLDMKLVILRQHCKEYGLKVSGMRSVLQQRLQEFSADRSHWDV
ncbi:hypothetical protein C0991_002626 [Blastosporella zonata]|nr:hypothetical protein C0991_002626 [Blastosporella zonata]